MSFFYTHSIMRRRVAEIIMVASGIAIAVGAGMMNITSLAYGGLAILGLGVISFFWR
ncbi:MAG TPA: hypothetical protein VFK40_04465 [Nitrososphaeraceae archaeon]|nr:hypothetical protein [Nitrososphaeraceae archaeon]